MLLMVAVGAIASTLLLRIPYRRTASRTGAQLREPPRGTLSSRPLLFQQLQRILGEKTTVPFGARIARVRSPFFR